MTQTVPSAVRACQKCAAPEIGDSGLCMRHYAELASDNEIAAGLENIRRALDELESADGIRNKKKVFEYLSETEQTLRFALENVQKARDYFRTAVQR